MIGPIEMVERVRAATLDDCQAIARIYNEGIAERRSTFETEPRSAADIEQWLGSPSHPVLVAERDSVVTGWARISPYSSRPCYAGVGEGSIYVRESERGRGVAARWPRLSAKRPSRRGSTRSLASSSPTTKRAVA